MTAPAGQYRLIAATGWREITSKPNEPRDWIDHVRGDIVTLDAAEARRLLGAGAVEPLDAAKASAGETTVPTSANSRSTVPELIAYAQAHGIELGDATAKADILALIDAAKASAGETT